MENRIERLLKAIGSLGMGGALFVGAENMRYFSGFTGEGMVFVGERLRLVLTDFRYTEQARAECPGFTVQEADEAGQYAEAGRVLDELGVAGYEADTLTVAQYHRLGGEGHELLPQGELPLELRSVKEPGEWERIRAAAAIADRAFAELLPLLRPGLSEREVAAELDYRMLRLGAEGTSFATIAASGPNGSKPHAVPTDRRLGRGDLLTLDFGCKLGGYCSDMTRTVAIGEPGPELRRVYGIVLNAQLQALEALKPGVTGRQVDAVAREAIAAQGYGERFGHGLGHGVGLFIHEEPRLTPRDAGERVLVPGNVVTIEPGIYLPGVGGVRIEDMCLLTEGGFVNGSASTKELLVL